MFICDGIQHCADGSDEARCQVEDGEGKERIWHCRYLESSINVKRLYRFPISECPGNGFKCNDGTCVPEHSFCNSIFDCSDGSDEPEQSCKREYRKKKSGEYCPLQCGNGRCRSAAVIINKNYLCLFIQSANVISIMFRFQGSLYRSRRLW